MTTIETRYSDSMKRPRLGSRLARFHALRLFSQSFPAIKSSMPFCSDVRRVIDEGEVIEEFEEEQDVVLTEEEANLAKRLPNPPAEHVSRRIALVRLENATLLGNTGKLIDERRSVLLRSRLEPLEVQVNDFRAEATRLMLKPAAAYVNFMGEYSGHAHFFHFLFDRLPRLYYLLERFALGRESLVILTNENPPAFQREIFAFVEQRYPNLRFQQIPYSERWRLPSLYSIDDYQSTTRATFLGPQTLAFMRSLIIDGYGPKPNSPYRKIYVSRGDARKRRLKNESELWPLFAARGFETVSAANLSFRDQVALFSEAAAIAGPHGAGLSHILFAPPGVKVLEIFPADKAFDVDYFYLAKATGGTYDAVIGSRGGRLGWFRANREDVKTVLDRF
ncbi:MAG TPA: glycosyltransferase family 61 protein [Rhizomicrobium sp.]|nr:glycosyltransferase family 61 protein [Rhizomicrobium sp.]